MATDVKLGISGSEVTLAKAVAFSLPTDIGKQMQTAVMSDGSVRYAHFHGQRRWQVTFNKLTPTELASLVTIRGYNQTLRFQNNWDAATWYNVVVTSLTYDMIDPHSTTAYYTASLTLEEVA